MHERRRPRTQRRTSEEPDSAVAGVTPSQLRCIDALTEELSCGICLDLCVRPCATPCGHAFCRSCLRQALLVKRACPQCRSPLPPPSAWTPRVNMALWNTIQLLFPRHAAQAPPATPTPPPPSRGAAATRRRGAGTSGNGGDDRAGAGAAARRGFRPPG